MPGFLFLLGQQGWASGADCSYVFWAAGATMRLQQGRSLWKKSTNSWRRDEGERSHSDTSTETQRRGQRKVSRGRPTLLAALTHWLIIREVHKGAEVEGGGAAGTWRKLDSFDFKRLVCSCVWNKCVCCELNMGLQVFVFWFCVHVTQCPGFLVKPTNKINDSYNLLLLNLFIFV